MAAEQSVRPRRKKTVTTRRYNIILDYIIMFMYETDLQLGLLLFIIDL